MSGLERGPREGPGKDIRAANLSDATMTSDSRTQIGVVMGTPAYISPEPTSGRRLDHHSRGVRHKPCAIWKGRPFLCRHLYIGLMQQNLAADPKDVRAKFELSEAVGELAAVYRDSDPPRSEKLYQRSLALSASALTSDPRDFDILYWQSFERIGFASLLAMAHKLTSAMDQLQQAIAVLEGLSDQDSTEISAHRLLALALQRRASQLAQLGSTGPADQDLQRSEEILVKLYKENLNNLTVLRDLADCYREKGNLDAHRSRWLDASREYQKSVDLWQRWPQIGKSSVYDQRQRQLAARLVRQARTHLLNSSFR